jgi:diguanylate cyclase (GGDEF)-like protein
MWGEDIVYRYGREEFAIVLPTPHLELAMARAEHVRLGVKQLSRQESSQANIPFTISLGVACFPQHGITVKVLVNSADRALYEAKTQGRDRVVAVRPAQHDSGTLDHGTAATSEVFLD